MSEEIQRIFDRLSTRLNDVLCEMRPDYDDSIVGFNEAWDIMRAVFKDELAKAALPSTPQAQSVAEVINDAIDGDCYLVKATGKHALVHGQKLYAAALPSTPQAGMRRRLDKYGVALMMISQGCSDPTAVADNALTSGWVCKACGWRGEMPNTKTLPDAMGFAQTPCCPDCDQHAALQSPSSSGQTHATKASSEEILKHADELHDLGFAGGWSAAVEECAKLIESGAGMADLIDQDDLDQQAIYIRELSSRSRSPGATETEGGR